MFILNKYYDTYMKIVNKAKKENRIYDSYIHEYHHIIPKSFGGTDSNENLIILTFREHYLCHRLLVKFCIGSFKAKMVFALHAFFHFDVSRKGKYKNDSRAYKIHKELFIEACKNRPYDYSAKKEIYHFKHMDSEESFYGRCIDFKNYSGLSNQEIYMLTTQHKKLLHIKRWGVFLKDKQIFSYEMERIIPPSTNKKCQYCGKTTNAGNYTRWHGEKCKAKKL